MILRVKTYTKAGALLTLSGKYAVRYVFGSESKPIGVARRDLIPGKLISYIPKRDTADILACGTFDGTAQQIEPQQDQSQWIDALLLQAKSIIDKK